MTLVRVNPRRKVTRSTSIFDHLFNELTRPGFHGSTKNQLLKNRPAVNIREEGDRFIIDLAAPGLQKEDFNIGVEKNILTIQVEKEQAAVEGEKVLRRGFNYNNFKRTFRLPETIDTNAIDASFVNGILSLSLAKKEEAKERGPLNIDVQ